MSRRVTWGLGVNPREVMPSPGGPASFYGFFTYNPTTEMAWVAHNPPDPRGISA